MGMSIDESIEIIKHEKPERPTSLYGAMKKNAFNTAIDAMRKYQKIEQIIDDCDLEAWEVLEKIKKVIEKQESRMGVSDED